MNRTEICGIGLMCGTSHDGLDLAQVRFVEENARWTFELLKGTTRAIPNGILTKLDADGNLSALELAQLDQEFGAFCAQMINEFLESKLPEVDFVASHGVTIFHQPEQSLTTQIGSGAVMSAQTQLPIVCDFRAQDVAKGGHGAPLVPFADKHLFHDYSHTLNLGGFANIADLNDTTLLGFDVGPCNLILNQYARLEGFPFDKGGEMAREASTNEGLLHTLNNLAYFHQPPPKSLGAEWISENLHPILQQSSLSNRDILSTFTEHIAVQIARTIEGGKSVLTTGGGAHNHYLIERIQAHSDVTIVIPSFELIEYKEAIDFAFLGALRMLRRKNISSSSTGAKSDSISGCVYLP